MFWETDPLWFMPATLAVYVALGYVLGWTVLKIGKRTLKYLCSRQEEK